MAHSYFFDLDQRVEDLDELLRDAHREAVPIRTSFLQIRGSETRPGPLGTLVRGGHHHAVDLYLLIHAATATPPHQIAINPSFWTRLVARPGQSARAARRALDRSIETLEWAELIERVTRLGVPVVQLLNEDGWGEPYVHPGRKGDRYLKLPHAYWEEELDLKLSLPAKAMLLVALSLDPKGFTLPLANAGQWYGVSADTLRRGMKELVAAKLAFAQPNKVAAPHTRGGYSIRRVYKLAGPVSRDASLLSA